jgi:hypothetical protein
MPRIYTHLTTQERAVVMTMLDDQCVRMYSRGDGVSRMSLTLRFARGFT